MLHTSFTLTVKKILLAATLVFMSISANAFTEGEDYVVLETPIPNAQGTLIKVFSYDCPFCYRYEKSVIGPVLEKLNDSLAYQPYHLETKPTYGKEASLLFATLLVIDQTNGKKVTDKDALLSKAKMAYYVAYHDKKERWDAGADSFLKTGLDATGISLADYEAAKQDPQVQQILDAWKASYEVAKIQGVPAFVVNGKYLIYTKNIKSIDAMVALITELAAKQ